MCRNSAFKIQHAEWGKLDRLRNFDPLQSPITSLFTEGSFFILTQLENCFCCLGSEVTTVTRFLSNRALNKAIIGASNGLESHPVIDI